MYNIFFFVNEPRGGHTELIAAPNKRRAAVSYR